MKLFWVTIFAIAMGFLEATVVVYLRKLYYPNGFVFPLKGFIDPNILAVEWVREFATIVMLLALGFIAGKKIYEKLAYFIFAFGIWDIFYYISLKTTLNWPRSFSTWDILFLIPWPWIGPVIAPVICSIIMMIMALLIIKFYDEGKKVSISWKEWSLFILAIITALYTWTIDYGKLIIYNGFAKEFFTLANSTEFYNIISNYIPIYYNYFLFGIASILALSGMVMFYLRMRKQ